MASHGHGETAAIRTVVLGVDVSAFSWSPDGRLIAAGLWDGRVAVLAQDGGVEWNMEVMGRAVEHVSWSPDASMLVAAASSGLVLLSRRGEVLWALEPEGQVHAVAWSSRGELAVGAGWYSWESDMCYGSLRAYAPESRLLWEKRWTLQAYAISWSSGDARLAVSLGCPGWEPGEAEGRIAILSPTGDILDEIGIPEGVVEKISWSPDGGVLAVATGDKLFLYAPGDGLQRLERRGGGRLRGIAWNPWGDTVAVAAERSLTLYARDGLPVWTIDYAPDRILGIAWDPRGDRLAVAVTGEQEGVGGRITILDTGARDRPTEMRSVIEVPGIPRLIAYSPTDRILAIATGDKIVFLAA